MCKGPAGGPGQSRVCIWIRGVGLSEGFFGLGLWHELGFFFGIFSFSLEGGMEKHTERRWNFRSEGLRG
jgi:hypothetical protein